MNYKGVKSQSVADKTTSAAAGEGKNVFALGVVSHDAGVEEVKRWERRQKGLKGLIKEKDSARPQ
jgi:hypothetical protein